MQQDTKRDVVVVDGDRTVFALGIERPTLRGILERYGVTSGEMFWESLVENPDLYAALYEYYIDEMPYGTAKARTGDPYEWLMVRVEKDMGW